MKIFALFLLLTVSLSVNAQTDGTSSNSESKEKTSSFTVPSFWSIRFVSDFTEYQEAVAASLNGTVRSIQLVSSFIQTKKLRFSDTPQNPSISLTINGNGNRITIADGIDTANVRSFADIDIAKTLVDFQIHFENIEFTAPSNCIMIYLSSCYQCSFNNSKFFGGKEAIEARWVLQGTVRECRFSDWTYVAVNLDFDEMKGGNNHDTQSNQWLFEQNNFRSPDFKTSGNAFACIRSRGNSGMRCKGDIYEGGDWNNNNKGCDYAVYTDDNGSTTVKIPIVMEDCHGEFTPALSMFYTKLVDGLAFYSRCFMQNEGNLIDFNSSAYAKCIVEYIPYIMTKQTFKNSGAGGRWIFSVCPAEFNPYSAARWSGKMPAANSISMLPGINPDGQVPFFQSGARKF